MNNIPEWVHKLNRSNRNGTVDDINVSNFLHALVQFKNVDVVQRKYPNQNFPKSTINLRGQIVIWYNLLSFMHQGCTGHIYKSYIRKNIDMYKEHRDSIKNKLTNDHYTKLRIMLCIKKFFIQFYIKHKITEQIQNDLNVIEELITFSKKRVGYINTTNFLAMIDNDDFKKNEGTMVKLWCHFFCKISNNSNITFREKEIFYYRNVEFMTKFEGHTSDMGHMFYIEMIKKHWDDGRDVDNNNGYSNYYRYLHMFILGVREFECVYM